jgi:xanthine dehydrogenase large subunit
VKLYCSTQHPSEVQAIVAHVLHWGRHQVVVEVPRMGGGFGGKETQTANYAAIAALGALKTGRPVKCWLNRDQDMLWTGKRHPFLTKWDVGFAKDGTIVALDAKLYSDGGFSTDLSRAILDRALFHSDNGYFLPNVRLQGAWFAALVVLFVIDAAVLALAGLLLFGSAYLVANAWWIGRALVLPPMKLEDAVSND